MARVNITLRATDSSEQFPSANIITYSKHFVIGEWMDIRYVKIFPMSNVGVRDQ